MALDYNRFITLHTISIASLNELCNWKCPLPISLSHGRGTSAPLLLREKGLGDEGQPLHNSFRFAIAKIYPHKQPTHPLTLVEPWERLLTDSQSATSSTRQRR